MATEETISFRTSKWKRFDPDFAEMIRTEHPDIWKLGGNIRGNDQYRKLYPITKRNGVPNSQIEIDALKLREAWNARHYNDFRIAGVIAQIKWLAVGSRGEQYMKNLVKEEILKRSEIKHADNLDDLSYFIERLLYHIDNDDALIQSDDMTIENALIHAGVKGMKWGVRNSKSKSRAQNLKSLGPDKIVAKTKYGETITLEKNKVTALHKAFARVSKNYAKEYEKQAYFDIKDSSGKSVGGGDIMMKPNKDLYLNFIEINSSARGLGYASASLQAAKDFGIKSGSKKMTLEVPGNAPDARHIYEKMGFKVTKEASKADIKGDPMWGGLTEMEYNFSEMKQSNNMSIEEALAHAGVKGMRWGVRKASSGKKTKGSNPAERTSYKKAPAKLSDAELRRRVNRMETEKRYIDLNPATAKKGKSDLNRVLAQQGGQLAGRAIAGVAVAGSAVAVKAYLDKKGGTDTVTTKIAQQLISKKKG